MLLKFCFYSPWITLPFFSYLSSTLTLDGLMLTTFTWLSASLPVSDFFSVYTFWTILVSTFIVYLLVSKDWGAEGTYFYFSICS
jgi:hypothetical protein